MSIYDSLYNLYLKRFISRPVMASTNVSALIQDLVDYRGNYAEGPSFTDGATYYAEITDVGTLDYITAIDLEGESGDIADIWYEKKHEGGHVRGGIDDDVLNAAFKLGFAKDLMKALSYMC